MKIKELKENQPLEVIEVSHYLPIPSYNKKGEIDKNKRTERRQIQMKIYTDGKIVKESDETHQKIKEYYIGKNKYQHDVDILKSKNIYFQNHSYVITCLYTNEFIRLRNAGGWFRELKDINIYLENPKDKKALREAKKVIKNIQYNNETSNYSSIYGMLFERKKEPKKLKRTKIYKDIFS